MAEKPVAKLSLDTRSHGQYVCENENCEEELEDAILMTDGSVVCPECGTPLEGFEQFSDVVMSAAPAKPGDLDAGASGEGKHVCDDDCRSYGCSVRTAQGRARRRGPRDEFER